MKIVVTTSGLVNAWIDHPQPAIFKGQDLRGEDAQMSALPLTDCVFLGCWMETNLIQAAAAAGCLVVPSKLGLPFNPFSPGLYEPRELYDHFDPDNADPTSTYHQSLDWLVYDSVVDPATKIDRPVDIDVILMRRVHDSSMSDAL
jgi:hypothetical protein